MATSKQQVLRLYRRALKMTFDWYPIMSEFREKSFIVRQMFEENRHVTSPQQIESLIKQTEDLLTEYRYHIPYANPHSPDGTKFERNARTPLDVVENGFGNYKSPGCDPTH